MRSLEAIRVHVGMPMRNLGSLDRVRVAELDAKPRAGAPLGLRAGRQAAGAADGAASLWGRAGTACARRLAFGASTPWKRIRSNRRRAPARPSRCMNSSGDITVWVVQSW